MNFQFPRAKFVDENGIAKQVTHMNSEQKEIEESVNTPDIFHTAVEVMDKFHSCETGLRILAEKYGIDLDDVRDHVEVKNRERGYYSVNNPAKETHFKEMFLHSDSGMKTTDGKDIISMPDGSNLPADEGWFMPTENPFIHGCCDCGLAHRVEWALIDKFTHDIIEDPDREIVLYLENLGVVLRFTRDEAETANLRKQKNK